MHLVQIGCICIAECRIAAFGQESEDFKQPIGVFERNGRRLFFVDFRRVVDVGKKRHIGGKGGGAEREPLNSSHAFRYAGTQLENMGFRRAGKGDSSELCFFVVGSRLAERIIDGFVVMRTQDILHIFYRNQPVRLSYKGDIVGYGALLYFGVQIFLCEPCARRVVHTVFLG